MSPVPPADGESRANRIRWPDGPVCPYCGERERMTPESRPGGEQLRYECVACERHRGYFRRAGSSTSGTSNGNSREDPDREESDREDAPHRAPIVPRFPG